MKVSTSYPMARHTLHSLPQQMCTQQIVLCVYVSALSLYIYFHVVQKAHVSTVMTVMCLILSPSHKPHTHPRTIICSVDIDVGLTKSAGASGELK